MFARISFSGAPSVEAQMLRDIKSSCGIFLKEQHYNKISALPSCSLQILWNNRDKFKDTVFRQDTLVDRLLQLTSQNLEIFFNRATLGIFGNAESLLSSLYQGQLAPPPVYSSPYPPQASAMYPPAYPHAGFSAGGPHFFGQPGGYQHPHGHGHQHGHDHHGAAGNPYGQGGAGQHHGHH